jgi:phospholipid/cholesterol/gamma-HCH transport system substrate-binding protein
MTKKTRLMVNMIVVVLLGVVMVGWLVANVLGSGIVSDDWEVIADFEESGGVFTNQEVTYRGVLVGEVGELSLNEDGIDIELKIQEEWRDKIPSNVIANVQSKSAVGEQFVNLTPTGEPGGVLQDGDRIARENTELPVDFQDLLGALDRVLRDIPPDAVANLTNNLAEGLGGRGNDLATILESLGDLSEAFAEAAPEQQRLLENAPIAGAEFLRTKEEFSAAIEAADEVFAGIGDEPEELAAFFRANDRFARRASSLFDRRADDLAAGIDGLSDLVDFQLEQRDSVIQGLQHIPEFLHAVEDASIPWQSPDGRTFYRLRVGLITDNRRSTWPCKYGLREDYERQPHVRDARPPVTSAKCEPEETEASRAAVKALIAELRAWVREHPEETGLFITDSITAGLDAAFEASFDTDWVAPTPVPIEGPTPEVSVTPTP